MVQSCRFDLIVASDTIDHSFHDHAIQPHGCKMQTSSICPGLSTLHPQIHRAPDLPKLFMWMAHKHWEFNTSLTEAAPLHLIVPVAAPTHFIAAAFFQLLRPRQMTIFLLSSMAANPVDCPFKCVHWWRLLSFHCYHLTQLPPLARILASFLTDLPVFCPGPFPVYSLWRSTVILLRK